MRTIRATCPLCTDEVELRPAQITLHLADGDAPGRSRYGFECPHCRIFVVKPAGTNAVELLLEGGVELSTAVMAPWESPSTHPEDPPGGAPFTRDDLLEFHRLLDSPDWFSELRTQLGR